MAEIRPIWRRAFGSASVAIGVFLAACSHDPIQPAPVYLKGATTTTDTRAPIVAAPVPMGPAGTRHAMAAPLPPVDRSAQSQHASKQSVTAGNHPTRVQKRTRPRLATRHVAPAPRKQATMYPAPARTDAPGAGGETIPLDGPAASTAWPPAVPPIVPPAATPPERTASPWVSPAAEPPLTEYRSPAP
jgi:hypothetical protein